MVVAGNETTTKLLGNALFHLSAHPDQRQRVFDDPGWIEPLDRGDAALRHLQPDAGPAPAGRRRAARRVAPAGSKLLIVLGSANRDERVFDRPDVYDIDPRPGQLAQLLSFGGGRHFCLGANLARLEARIALEELVRRVRTVEVDRDRRRAGALDQRAWLRATLPVTVEAR